MQKARRHPPEGRLRPLVSAWFQVLFTAPFGVLLIIQSPYWFTIGRRGVFSLGGWSPHVHAGFHEPDATLGLPRYATTGLLPSVVGLPRPLMTLRVCPFSLAATYGIAVAFFSSGY